MITRFAPSPTGYLHVGGARTALFNWLLARNMGGKFLLRIEDTDRARSTTEATDQLIEDLRWLGLNWDNAELVYQSKRLDVYNKLIGQLIADGKAYEAWETSDELEKMRMAAQASKRPFLYKRPSYSSDMLARFKSEGREPVIRFAMPVKEYRFHDVTLGREVVQTSHEVQDFNRPKLGFADETRSAFTPSRLRVQYERGWEASQLFCPGDFERPRVPN
jgi:glutamyl/glutaminyl-tRNA synthetase